MEPIKSLAPVAKWFLRFALAIILYNFYFKLFEKLDFDSLEYMIAFVLIICAATVIAGGFLKQNTVTVVSGLVICILSVIMMFVGDFDLQSLITNFVPSSLGFYFMTVGNKG